MRAVRPAKKMMEQSARGKRVVCLVTLLRSVIQMSTITISDVKEINYFSCESSDRFWVSGETELLNVDSRGNVLRRPKVGFSGISTNTDGELLFSDTIGVKKLESNGIITTLFAIDESIWCIHSSRINGDILLGLRNTTLRTSKVTRYDVTGQKILDIEEDNQGVKLYAITKLHHREQERGYLGICTDILRNVLVCNSSFSDPGVHLLDQDGQFLSMLLTKEHNVQFPKAVCVDDKHNLYLGQYGSNIITVYKYLQVSEN
ncbi:uncharacterized protein LOC134263507 [Saccostrea cucullata]|uniref:uncharacterized protein LOC134263507 n=1 Tax=Saccostrea cuccullata TaxID=36930 RepID=UPI002ED0FCC0